MSMYRCAVCGSSHVVVDSKREGFSIGKGIAGTALFGAPGVIAGVNGKTEKYYHCAACGQTLSYSMSESEKNIIDNYLEKPKLYENLLTSIKKTYPNIEWKPVEENQSKIEMFGSDSKLSVDDTAEKIWNYYLKNQIPYIEIDELFKNALGDNYDYIVADKALQKLKKRGVLKKEYRYAKLYCMFFSDPEKIKMNLNEEFVIQMSENIFLEHRDELVKELLNQIHPGSQVTLGNVFALFYDYLNTNNLSDNNEVAKTLAKRVVSYTQSRFFIRIVESDNENDKLLVKLSDTETSTAKEQRLKEIKEKTKQRQNKIEIEKKNERELILKCFSKDERKTVSDIAANMKMSERMSNQKILGILNIMVEEGLMEKVQKNKKIYFSLPGVSERLMRIEMEQKKQREEEEKIRRQRVNEQILKLETEIREQIQIIEKNTRKFFGQGAKEKKEAKAKVIQLQTEMDQLKEELR